MNDRLWHGIVAVFGCIQITSNDLPFDVKLLECVKQIWNIVDVISHVIKIFHYRDQQIESKIFYESIQKPILFVQRWLKVIGKNWRNSLIICFRSIWVYRQLKVYRRGILPWVVIFRHLFVAVDKWPLLNGCHSRGWYTIWARWKCYILWTDDLDRVWSVHWTPITNRKTPIQCSQWWSHAIQIVINRFSTQRKPKNLLNSAQIIAWL